MTGIFKTAAVGASGIAEDHDLAPVLAERSDIMTMTQQAHDAALTPVEPGGLSHSLRAALSCRMARLNGEDAMAAHFQTMIGSGFEKIDDPAFAGDGDDRLRAIIRHTDLVTTDAKSVVEGDISALKEAGVSEDDIVRLSELVAFVNYQVRLAAGLKLLGEMS
jgi:uncharacterized protein YciW